MPYTVEESIRADNMTYGHKTNETSIKNEPEPVKKRTYQSIKFVSQSVNDSNASSSLADELIVEDVVGDEQESNSDQYENFINELNPDSRLMHDIFNLFLWFLVFF
ncbi:hypothetical protein Hanom_Chr02g00125881 [Helianthus anomalus]